MDTDSRQHEVPLRVGLAARALPDTDAGRLLRVLEACVGLPLTDEKLRNLSLHDLTRGAGGALSELPLDSLDRALAHLRGAQGASGEALPTIESYREGDMPGSLRVACASNSGATIDGHFGSCARFLVYQVSVGEIRLVDIRPTLAGDTTAEGKNEQRIRLIADCQLLFVASIGGPPAARVTRRGIHPMKVAQGTAAREQVQQVQSVLSKGPPPWLARSVGRSTDLERFLSDLAG